MTEPTELANFELLLLRQLCGVDVGEEMLWGAALRVGEAIQSLRRVQFVRLDSRPDGNFYIATRAGLGYLLLLSMSAEAIAFAIGADVEMVRVVMGEGRVKATKNPPASEAGGLGLVAPQEGRSVAPDP